MRSSGTQTDFVLRPGPPPTWAVAPVFAARSRSPVSRSGRGFPLWSRGVPPTTAWSRVMSSIGTSASPGGRPGPLVVEATGVPDPQPSAASNWRRPLRDTRDDDHEGVRGEGYTGARVSLPITDALF